MTPYVIDNRKQLTIYLLFILGIIISFGLGCVFGYQIANTESMLAPTPVIEQSAEADSVTDEVMEGDKVIEDTKKPDNKSAVEKKKSNNQQSRKKTEKVKKTAISKPQTKPAIVKKAKPVIKKPVVRQQKKTDVVKQPVTVKKPKQLPAKKVAPTVASQKTVTQPSSVNTENDKVESSATTTEQQPAGTSSTENSNVVSSKDNKRYYSVQAGLFANRENAVKYLDELLGNGFDAYLVDFVSTSGVVKYNVRFGRSEDRKTSRKRLSEFRQAFTTPAYIVMGN